MGAGKFYLIDKLNLPKSRKNLSIVEIGSENGEGSSEFFAKYAKKNNISFYTIDFDKNNYNKAKLICEKFNDSNNKECEIQAYHMKGEYFLENIFPNKKKNIIFLYLDNFDFIFDTIVGKKWVQTVIDNYKKKGELLNNENSITTHYEQMLLAYNYFNDYSFILCDDTFKRKNSDNWDGKCAKVVPYLQKRNWIMLDYNEAQNKHWKGYILFGKTHY